MKKALKISGILAATIGVGVVATTGIFGVQSTKRGQLNAPTKHRVTYLVENANYIHVAASVTIENETGGTEQRDVTLPWKKEFTPEPGQFLYVAAQTDGWAGIEVSILLDGQTVRHALSTSKYGSASVSARMP